MKATPMQLPRRRLAVYLLAGMALFSAISALQGSLLGNIIDTYQLAAAVQGLPTSAAFAGGLLALLTTFLLSSRLPKWAALMGAFVICGGSLLLLTVSSPFPVFIALWFVLGFGMGLLDTLLSACMAQLYDGRGAVLMMCLLHAAYGVCGTAVPVVYRALLGSDVRWNAIYFLPALLAVVLLAAGLFARSWRFDPPAVRGDGSGSIFRVIRENRLYFWIAAMFFHGFFLSGLNTWINRFAERTGAPVSFMPAMSFMFLGIMISRLALSFLPIPPRRYVCVAGIAGGIALFTGALVPSVLNGCLLVTGTCFGALIPIMLTMACSRLRDNTLAATTALVLALYLGEAVSSPVIGVIESTFSLTAGIIACAVSMVLCSGCCILEGVKRVKRDVAD